MGYVPEESTPKPSHALLKKELLRAISTGRCMQEDEMADKVQTCVMDDAATYPLLQNVQDTIQSFESRPLVASIAVIDEIVL